MSDLMTYIRPVTITDAMSFTTNVTEDDHDIYEPGTTYDVGTRVIMTTGYHRIYESLKASNTGNNPPDNLEGDEPWWEDVSATNAWKISDGKSRAATVAPGDYSMSVIPAKLVNIITLLNVEATEVVVTVTHPTLGTVYRTTENMVDLSHVDSYYSWFFGEPARKASLVLDDLPAYTNATILVSVKNDGDQTTVGEIVMGARSIIGQLLWDYSIGFTDWSDKKIVDGVATIVERTYSNEPSFTVKISKSSAAAIDKKLKEYRARGIVMIGTSDQRETIVYGFITSLKLVGKATSKSIYNIGMQELS